MNSAIDDIIVEWKEAPRDENGWKTKAWRKAAIICRDDSSDDDARDFCGWLLERLAEARAAAVETPKTGDAKR